MEHLDNIQDVLLITFGAVLGANTRFIIYQKLEKINLSNNYIILVINTFSSFLLGFCLSISSQIDSFTYSYQSGLFFSIGFLGSLSTFSTFFYDFYDLLKQFKFYIAFKFFLISMSLGIIFIVFGFLLGNL